LGILIKYVNKKTLQLPQTQAPPGLESEMKPKPKAENEPYRGSGKLKDKIALITGGDSGIGRAVAISFAKEGADVAIVYLQEHQDANETKNLVAQHGPKAVSTLSESTERKFCQQALEQKVREFGKLDIIVNNAAE
jgi:shikimate 5-dehydrogenase